jgi:alkylation response protein AidB-like acyl-CoA dehydrogenase
VSEAAVITPDAVGAEARDFITSSIADDVACPSFGAIMPTALFERARRWQRHCYDHGFAGIDWPAEFGGRGLSAEHALAWSAECATAGVTPYMNFQGIVLAGGAIRKFGTDEQRARFLDATLRADIVWCQLFSEPGAGSDLVSLSTRAERSGGGWVVTGQKVWSSTAQLAQHAILLARTNGDEPGHRGISFFLFDMDTPGVDVRPIKQMTGDSEFCEVFLDGAMVAADGLLGPLHGGWTVATSVLADERSQVGAAAIGLQRRLAALAEAVHGDEHRDRLAAIRASGGALARLLERSGGDPTLGPLNKLAMTELDGRITTLAVDASGADGMLDGPLTEPFLYSPGMRVAGGTSEIQRNLIGERLLGLPREPKPR